jgi:hypothetical protein
MVNPATSNRTVPVLDTATPAAADNAASPGGPPSTPPPTGYSDQDTFQRTSAPAGKQAARDPYVYGPTYDMVKAGQGPGWEKGLRGPGVEKMQGLLRGAGYSAPQNGGRFDNLTDGAVRNFQRDHKLSITGRVDQGTLQALEAAQPHGGRCGEIPTPPPVCTENGAHYADPSRARGPAGNFLY